ncbi:MAG: AAA family ATPase, partial [Planctomycetales bacterium]|nr:AAA family ATPase [Planctomycetales bacterium]
PGGGWEWSVKGVRAVPYRLPELLAEPTGTVFVAEGEKDCDNLVAIGVLATCNAGGAKKWTTAHSEFLRDRRAIVLPDNDDAGRNHAQQVAQSLHGIAASVRIVELPNLPSKGDVSDWIAAGGTKDELLRLADTASVWRPKVVVESGPILTCLADVEPRDVSWLWPERIPLGRITLLVGRPGEGKSFLTTDAAARVTTRTPWPDGSDCPQGSVILISAEDDPADTIRPRLDAHCADVRRVHLLSAVRRVDGDEQYERLITLADVDAIEASLLKLPDCKLIVVDPIGSFLGGGTDAHRDNEVRGVLAPIAKLAEKHGPAVLVVAHRRKSVGNFADDTALGSRAFTGIARAVWHLTRDVNNKARRLLLPGKNNLAHEGDGLAFSIIGEPARISWERDPVAMSADDALAAEGQAREQKPGPEAKALDAASAWLGKTLASGPRLAKDLLDEWKNGQGGSKRTLDRAKQSLAVEAYRPETPGPWWWRLPGKDANVPEDAELGNLGNLAEDSANLTEFEGDGCKDAKLPEPGNVGNERVRVTI